MDTYDVVIGICSGYFRLLHIGHLQYLDTAKSKCTTLVVIANNDHQLRVHKQKYSPYSELDRCKLLLQLKSVDYVQLSIDKGDSVSESIHSIYENFESHFTEIEPQYDIKINRKYVFFNDGDVQDVSQLREYAICQKLGIEIQFLNNPKVDSSTDIEEKVVRHYRYLLRYDEVR